jgi:integrase/recombinase XerD
MSALSGHVEEYLRARRALGVKLERHGQLLPQLIAYLEAAGERTVTRDLAISWARLPTGAHPQHRAARLSVARGFATYLQTIDAATEIPPAGVFAVRYQRAAPYLWSSHDICRLLDATRAHAAAEGGELRGPVRAARSDGDARRRSGRARPRSRRSRQ